MDGPHEGSKFMSTKWMVITRVKNLHRSTMWTDPTRDQIHVHKVDGPNKGQKLT